MMHDDSRTVLFDGICHLCNAAVRFIIKRDPEGVFRFAPMQSDIGRALIEKYHGSGFEPDTILLIKNGVCHEGSDAVLEILKELNFVQDDQTKDTVRESRVPMCIGNLLVELGCL